MNIGIDASNIRTGGGKKQLEDLFQVLLRNLKIYHLSLYLIKSKQIIYKIYFSKMHNK